MFPLATLLVLASLGQETAADAVTLKDGKVILGQVVDSDRRGPLLVIVRRDWAAKNLPDRLAAWEKAEGPTVQRAEAQHRDRLAAWRRDRPASPAPDDRISAYLDRELARKPGSEKSPLMVVRLARNEVKAADRRPRATGRMLRLGWLSDFEDVEAMAPDRLSDALEGRGFAPKAETPVSLDSLLPPQAETDAHWIARRAATEQANDPGARFLRFGSALLPEPAPGEAPPVGAAIDVAASAIKDLLGENRDDPLAAKLRDLAAQGRVGALVTKLDLAPDFSTAAIEATLWVRVAREKWAPALVRRVTANPDALPADAGAPLADDPQVKAAVGAIEGLGFGTISPDLKARGLNMGAATRIALGQARSALAKELDPLTISLEAPRERAAAGKPRRD